MRLPCIAEPLVIILMEKCGYSRQKSAMLVGLVAWFLGLGSALSFNVWAHVKLFKQFTLFDVATDVPADILLPLGGFGFAIFAGWVMTRLSTQRELALHSPVIYRVWRGLIRYVAPILIFIVFIASIT